MVHLYLNEYLKSLVGRRVCIACREGVLRDNFKEIVADIKFLSRYGIETTLFHNLPSRFANQKIEQRLEKSLPATNLLRIGPEEDFYQAVLNHPDIRYKLIFLERRCLIDTRGSKINTLTTQRVRASKLEFRECIGNQNFKTAMTSLCETIEAGKCERIHILPAGKNSIKHELFTVEGSGTMLADNFIEKFHRVESDDEVALVHRILTMYKRSGYLKPRSRGYISRNRHRFFVTVIDGIAVGCLEQKIIDENTVELGALAISPRFRNQRIAVFTVNAFREMMASQGFVHMISLTKNPRLQVLYGQLGFVRRNPPEYRKRQDESPGVPMFYMDIAPWRAREAAGAGRTQYTRSGDMNWGEDAAR
jgi:N-acetylglutamate synthase-like GNAT family acetyltransferase